MQITILAIGKNMPAWVTEGCSDYIKRMPANCRVQLIEISFEKRTKNSNLQKMVQREEAKIKTAILNLKDNYCVALDRIGKTQDTKTLAKRLQTWRDNQQSICFVIGGPEGLSEKFLKNANEIWSLSAMTFPHSLARLMLTEQIYRAWSIIINHPYHR